MEPKDSSEETPDILTTEICAFEEYDQDAAKEKASIQWLLSKAFNGIIPGDLQEPFYRDHERQNRLKPKIVHSLASAELYCLSLANIYADPNYHNLDHHGIIQALMRKGVFLVESKDAPLTETVLVQTAPFRMNAHMAVIDGIMSLYTKEVLIPEKIIEVVRGFSCLNLNSETPSNPEEAAVLWINKCCKTLEYEIQEDSKSFDQECSKLPRIPVLQEISDISDGCSIAAVISFYCPDCLNWRDICWNEPMSLGDSIYNLNLIRNFCSKLPRNIYFLTLEDFLYLHPSIKDNVLAFVADLLYLFVIWPTSCVTRSIHDAQSETSHAISEDSKQLKNFPLPQKIEQIPCIQTPNLRADSHGGSTSSLPDRVGLRIPSRGPKEKFLTKHFSSRKTSLSNEALELSCQIQRTSSAGLINGKSANIPLSSPVNSLKALRHYGSGDESTIFGESHSGVSFPYIGDDRERYSSKFKESKVVNNSADPRGKETYAENSSNIRKLDSMIPPYHKQSFVNDLSNSPVIENGDLHHKLEGRQSVCLEDYYKRLANEDGVLRSNSTSNIGENKNLKNVKNRYILESDFSPNYKMVLDPSGTFSSGVGVDDINNKNLSTTSFAQLSKLKCPIGNSINIVYMQHDRDGCNPGGDKNPLKSSFLQKQKLKNSKSGLEKKTTFATLPNTTTWQQQRAVSSRSPQTDSGHETPTEAADSSLNTQLCNVRMKLEEKRRKIEQDKRRMEALWKRQRQKLGKAAFLQAVSKTSASGADTPDSGTGKDEGENESPVTDKKSITNCRSPSSIRRMSIQEIEDDLDTVQRKWLDPKAVVDKYVPDAILSDVHVESEADESLNINAEDFQTSIEHLNCSLNDIQADISRILYQQEHIESLMQNNEECEGKDTQFFLHEQHSATELPESLEDSLYCDEQNQQLLSHSPNPLLMEIGTHRSCCDYNKPSGQILQQTVSADENKMLGLEHEQHLISLPPVTRDFSFATDTPPQDYLYSKVMKKDSQNYANKQPHSLPCQDMSCKSTFSAPCSGSGMFSLLTSQQKINDSVVPPRFSPVHKNQTFGRGIGSKTCRNLFEETNSDSFLRKQLPYAYSPIHNVPQHAKQIPKTSANTLKGTKVSDESGKGFYISFNDQPKKSKPKSKIKPVSSEQNSSDAVDKIILNDVELDQSRGVSRPATERHSGRPSKDQSHPGDNAFGFVIGADLVHPDPDAENEMARKKEMIMLMSLRRRADQETQRTNKERENARLREEEQRKKEYANKKREEERVRRQVILEQYRQRKIQEELEKEGLSAGPQGLLGREHAALGKTCASKTSKLSVQGKKKDNRISSQFTKPIAELRSQISQNNQSRQSSKPRPKSAYLLSGGSDPASMYAVDCQANKRNSHYISSGGDGHDFDIDSLNSTSTSSSRRTHSPCNLSCHTSPTQGGSFPCETIPKPTEGILSGPSSEGTSDTASTASSAVAAEYTGPKLFVKPTAKSNKGIIINAINTVLAGAVNSETKRKVIEEINRSESKHFLILFRDAGCQFRAIYSYNPDREEVIKMYGIGPKTINDQIMDRFYKYNSGGKCFSEVQTKHLTVTIDAFTIPNSLWAGKKVIPPKKEFF